MVSCLLIDRNEKERERVSRILAELGVNCAQRAKEVDALQYCSEHRPDFVVVEASQYVSELFQGLRGGARHESPIVICYSGDSDVEIMGRVILAGASDFLVKPFDRDLLKFKLVQAGVALN